MPANAWAARPIRHAPQSGVAGVLPEPDDIGALVDRQALVLTLVVELLGGRDLQSAIDAFVGELQLRLKAERVCLGIVDDTGAVELAAISQQASVDVARDESRLLADVMQECLGFERTIRLPDPAPDPAPDFAAGSESGAMRGPGRDTGSDRERDDTVDGRDAHRALCSRIPRHSWLSVPLFSASEPVGVLLLERDHDRPFESEAVDLLEHVAAACAPSIALHREAERSALARLRRTVARELQQRFGTDRVGARALLASVLAVVLCVAFLPLPHRISAPAELVPQERRMVSAPFEGFVEAVLVRAGEYVQADQPLARMDLGELELEGARRDGELAGAEAEFRSAMAQHDRKATAITRARLASERARRAIVEQRKQRVELRAPMDGVVVSGDPADMAGAPVSRGEVLFEVARADGYEVHLMVHERDIREVREGQNGQLTLRARPDEKLDVHVEAIHPVAESADGASRFRVRAAIDLPADVTLRPGETGVARLEAGYASLLTRLGRPVAQRLTELWWRFST